MVEMPSILLGLSVTCKRALANHMLSFICFIFSSEFFSQTAPPCTYQEGDELQVFIPHMLSRRLARAFTPCFLPYLLLV